MDLNFEELQKIDALVKRSQRILIISHRNPDGDTIGAGLGLYHALSLMGKSPEVLCIDPPADVFAFMPGIEQYQVGEPTLNYDAYFIVDAGATHLTGFHESHPELFDKSLEVVNIDHHQSNDFYGKYNLVMPDVASATAVVFEMLEQLNYPVDRHAATCLLTGVYTDTGSFMHSNTSAEILRIAAKLLSKGANLRSISKDIFNTTKISTMRLWGRVLRNVTQTEDKVTMSVLRKKDFEDTGADYSEITGVVDYINSVPGSQYSVILTERDGKVKGSLRTLKEEVNVADIASSFGGGGHTKAAGFAIEGRLEKEVKWKVVK